MFSFIVPSLFWTLIVLLLSIVPGSNFTEQSTMPNFDKIVHFIMYMVMVHLWMVGLKKQMRYPKVRRNAHVLVFFGVFLFSIIMEVIQHYWIVDRYFDFFDLSANFFGCIFGMVIFELLYRGIYA